ncbi:hypothetical protein CKQ16_10445 [Salmonella enterica subsp. enterica serovar Newport]|nr:hypothetical protein [Salmonella enterica subsp. enterica serovar Newport]
MTATTNPLAAMNIKKLIGFKQITPGVLNGDFAKALQQCGVEDINPYTYSDATGANSTTYSTGKMTVLGNTFCGLVSHTGKGGRAGYIILTITANAAQLKNKAMQVGFRMTQSAVDQGGANYAVASVFNGSQIGSGGIASTGTEDTSAYYEIVFTMKSNNEINAQAFLNKQAVWYGRKIKDPNNNYITVMAGSNQASIITQKDEGYTLMIGDIYIAELDYNSDGTATPQLLGNLTLEPFTVENYSGDKHSNTKNQDIVTALNTIDPNHDMGVLAIKPVEQAASVTFNAPNIAGKTIYGASLNIVYKDSIAPNNRLRYQVTEGTTQLPAEAITTRNTDVTGYTTFSKTLTAPAGGGAWNTENLKFKLDMMNEGAE